MLATGLMLRISLEKSFDMQLEIMEGTWLLVHRAEPFYLALCITIP